MKNLKFLTFFLTVLVITFTPLDALEISEGSGVTLGRYFFIAMAISAIFSKDLILKQNVNIFKTLVCFIIWATLTTFWSLDEEVTFQRVLLLIQYAIIFCVMVNSLDSPRKIRMAMAGWILGTVYIAFKTITDFNLNVDDGDKIYRVNDFGNPNENSFMLCYALLFCYIIDKTRLRIPSILFTAYSTYAFIANGSRMGIILFLLAVTGFCFQLWTNKKRMYVILLIPAIIIFGTYVLNNIPEATLYRILGITENIERGTFSHREEIWESALMMISQNEIYALIGCGWGAFNIAIYKYYKFSIGAHNFYLDLFCTTGLIGLSIVICYLSQLFLIIKKTYKANIVNYLLLLIPLISMSSTNWQSRRWWFMMGAFIYLIYKTNNLKLYECKKELQR